MDTIQTMNHFKTASFKLADKGNNPLSIQTVKGFAIKSFIAILSENPDSRKPEKHPLYQSRRNETFS